MAVICPSITAPDKETYRQQMDKIAGFADRIQIDLTDGDFAHGADLDPKDAWWPVGVKADFHLMYKSPDRAIEVILEHSPHLIIIHAEADGNFLSFAEKFRQKGIKIGLAILPRTGVDSILPALVHLDHVLIFSGNLGEFGGHANMDLLRKARQLKDHKPSLEVGWDGGVNQQNISQLAFGGVDVFNVGGFLQHSQDPQKAYEGLLRIATETGTT